jgi:ferredoxin/flavodoxin---NADP+ reductase
MMHKVKVVGNERVSAATFLLRVERPDIKIKAGQCFNIGSVKSGINREYSMYSDANANFVEFLIREVDGGIVSPDLASLKDGDEVELAGPYGEFCIENSLGRGDQHFTFIGTGTGIAPFRSFIKTFDGLKYKIVHGIRTKDEQYSKDEYSKHSYIPCFSMPDDGTMPFRVTDYLKENKLEKHTTVYLCGNRKMISDVFDLCRDQGINGSNIYTEVFF